MEEKNSIYRVVGLSPSYIKVKEMVEKWHSDFMKLWHGNLWYWEHKDGIATESGKNALAHIKRLGASPIHFSDDKEFIVEMLDIALRDFESASTERSLKMKSELERLRDIVVENDFHWAIVKERIATWR